MTATITPAATLAKRGGYVWGYVNGDSNSPVSCPGNLTPTIPTDAPNSIFCCDQASCVNDWHTCIDYLGTGCAEPDICSEIYTSYLQCNAETPSCLSYVRVTDPFGTMGLTSLACAATGGELKVLVTPTNGGSASTPTGNSNSGGDSSGDSSSSGDFSGSGGSGLSSSSVSGQKDNHSLTAGAIVGIVIGAMIVILLVVGLIFWIKKCSNDRRRRKQEVGAPSKYADTEYSYRMREFNMDQGR